MFELPLFPLHTVLFPGTPIHLHIFEERYKQMINLCVEEHRPFGVVLIREGMEALGPLAVPHSTGCTANVLNIQRLDQGQMNIVATGQVRFQIQSLDFMARPYLVGMVETYPIDPAPGEDLEEFGSRLRIQLENYIELLLTTGGSFDTRQLPREPVELAYMAAALVQVPPIEKQTLLELNDPAVLLSSLRRIYSREYALLKAMQQHRSEEGASFSRN